MELEDEFQNYCLRIDLLNVDFECFWVLRVPDWFSLSELHQCLLTVLDWPETAPCEFDFENGSYRESRVRSRDTRRTYLSDAFQDVESAYYVIHREASSWTFQIRRVMVCSDVTSTVTLLHGEEFPPPADCANLETYSKLYYAGDLERKPPAEQTERKLQHLERNTTNWLGNYRSLGMTLFQCVVAALLERENRPISPEEMEARLFWSDYEKTLSPSAIKRAAKKSPLTLDQTGRLLLDQDSPEYDSALASLAAFRDPADGVKLLVKRFHTHGIDIEGGGSDIVLVVDSQDEIVQGVEICQETDGLEPFISAINRAISNVPRAHALVVDEDRLDLELEESLGLPVELRFSLEELTDPFLTLDHPSIKQQACVYPPNLARRDLADFCDAAQRFLLLAPWSFITEPEVFCVEGLRPKPVFAVVLGFAYQIYGLSLFEDFGELLRLLRGERPCSPYCFMDFPNTIDAKRLRQTLDREQIPYLSRDTCPYVYGNRTEASPENYDLVTNVLNLISGRLTPLAGPISGTSRTEVNGQTVTVTWPVDLSEAL